MSTEQITRHHQSVGRTRVIFSQVIACLALDFLLIGLGMSISFATMVVPEVLNAKKGLSITEEQASWFGSIAFLCQPLGSVFSGPLLDYFGRKKALFIVNIPHLVAWVLMSYAWDVPSLFLGNALLGIGTGIMEAPSVTYIGEISDPSIRGILTTLTNGFTSAGMFCAHLLGSLLPWRQAALAALAVPLTAMLLVLFVPETPIWLLTKGRQKEALQSLCRIRGWVTSEAVKDEFDQLLEYNDMVKKCIICEREGKTYMNPCEHSNHNTIRKTILTAKHVLFARETMRPFLLVMGYFFFYTMSGLIPIKPNMVNICKSFGMLYDAKVLVVFVGVIFIVMSLLSALAVKLIGKRKLVIGSLFATALCSLSISIYASTSLPPNVFSYEDQTYPEKKDILPIVLFLLLVCFTSLGIPWTLLSEVFPYRSRGIATGLAAAMSYAFSFIAIKSNYNLEASFHLHGTFAIYASFGLIGTIYMYLYLPETENKSLVVIEAYFKGEQKIFANDFLINRLRKGQHSNSDADKPMLTI